MAFSREESQRNPPRGASGLDVAPLEVARPGYRLASEFAGVAVGARIAAAMTEPHRGIDRAVDHQDLPAPVADGPAQPGRQPHRTAPAIDGWLRLIAAIEVSSGGQRRYPWAVARFSSNTGCLAASSTYATAGSSGPTSKKGRVTATARM